MSRHLSEETLLDLVEGRADETSRAHLVDCASCAARVSEAAQALSAARAAEVPEPPQPYWNGFGRAVSRRIDESARRPSRWGWLVPLGAAAAAVAVIALVPSWRPAPAPAPPAEQPAAALPSWSALPPIEQDDATPILEAAASGAEPGLAALDDGRGLGWFVAALTDDEAQALAEALRAQRKDGAL
ncbi:MAG: hypothetical protein ACM3PV_13980 [Betaproteobacteria bacterium]